MKQKERRMSITPLKVYEYYINGVKVYEGTMDGLVEWSGVARTTLVNQMAERQIKDGSYRLTLPTDRKVYVPREYFVEVDKNIYDFYLGHDLLMTGTIDFLAYEWNTSIRTLEKKTTDVFKEPRTENVIQLVLRKE